MALLALVMYCTGEAHRERGECGNRAGEGAGSSGQGYVRVFLMFVCLFFKGRGVAFFSKLQMKREWRSKSWKTEEL